MLNTHSLTPLTTSLLAPPPSRPQVVYRVPAKGARVLAARLEPLVQTRPVEQVAARVAALVRHLPVGRDDGVADGALGLALERADDVAAEGHEAVDDAAVLQEERRVRTPGRKVKKQK